MNAVTSPAVWNVAFTATKVVELPGSTKCQPQPACGHDPVPKPGLVEPTCAGLRLALYVGSADDNDGPVNRSVASSAPAAIKRTLKRRMPNTVPPRTPVGRFRAELPLRRSTTSKRRDRCIPHMRLQPTRSVMTG